MQLMGVDINPSSLSKLEGQTRSTTDIELKAIAAILGVSVEDLLQESDEGNQPYSPCLIMDREFLNVRKRTFMTYKYIF